MNIDDVNVISYYVGKVVPDKKRVLEAPMASEGILRHVYGREVQRDTGILSVLKCAKANGYSGEV